MRCLLDNRESPRSLLQKYCRNIHNGLAKHPTDKGMKEKNWKDSDCFAALLFFNMFNVLEALTAG